MKEDAIDVVKALQDSSHYVTMIIGDALLTALHVARVTQIAHKDIHLLEKDQNGQFAWRHADQEDRWVDFDQFDQLDELGMTGSALTWLLDEMNNNDIVKRIQYTTASSRIRPDIANTKRVYYYSTQE